MDGDTRVDLQATGVRQVRLTHHEPGLVGLECTPDLEIRVGALDAQVPGDGEGRQPDTRQPEVLHLRGQVHIRQLAIIQIHSSPDPEHTISGLERPQLPGTDVELADIQPLRSETDIEAHRLIPKPHTTEREGRPLRSHPQGWDGRLQAACDLALQGKQAIRIADAPWTCRQSQRHPTSGDDKVQARLLEIHCAQVQRQVAVQAQRAPTLEGQICAQLVPLPRGTDLHRASLEVYLTDASVDDHQASTDLRLVHGSPNVQSSAQDPPDRVGDVREARDLLERDSLQHHGGIEGLQPSGWVVHLHILLSTSQRANHLGQVGLHLRVHHYHPPLVFLHRGPEHQLVADPL